MPGSPLQSPTDQASPFLLLPRIAHGETRVAETGADGEDSPALVVLHKRNFAQALHHAVIVHQNRRVVIADSGDRLDQAGGQVELAALPIARQVLCALLD